MSIDFDDYAADYRLAVERSTSFSGKGLDFFTTVKVRLLLELISRHIGGPGGCALLDVGCGPGVTDELILPHVGGLVGVDTSQEMVVRASVRNLFDKHYFSYGATTGPTTYSALPAATRAAYLSVAWRLD